MGGAREFDVVMVTEPQGGYSGFVPKLPSIATHGEGIEEACANAEEAIGGYLEVMPRRRTADPLVHRDRVVL
jgi:predicted RNase H-like HicB family nuclease